MRLSSSCANWVYFANYAIDGKSWLRFAGGCGCWFCWRWGLGGALSSAGKVSAWPWLSNYWLAVGQDLSCVGFGLQSWLGIGSVGQHPFAFPLGQPFAVGFDRRSGTD